MIKKIKNIEIIKMAIEVEIKHNYVNIIGKKSTFSKFIAKEIRSIIKLSPKDGRWQKLLELFEYYHMDDISNRMVAVKKLIQTLRNPFEEETEFKTNQTESNEIKPQKTFNPKETDITYVKGVGPKVARVLNKLNLFTAYDLLTYYPKSYLDYGTRTPISEIEEGQRVSVFGTITEVQAFISPKRTNLTIVKITVSDGSGKVTASWFYGKSNRYMLERYKAQYPKGSGVILSGVAKFDTFTGFYMIDKAEATIISALDDDKEMIHNGRIVPVYPLTENLHAKTLRRAIYNALATFIDKIEELIPEEIINRLNLIDKKTALKEIHFPSSDENLAKAKKRLIFEELFMLQLKFAIIREHTRKTTKSEKITIKKSGLVDKFVKSLPFKLTEAQNNAFNEILTDLGKEEPMQRLLQGDVGSGKTVVACMMLLAIVENGYQAAIMAPTEILAEQHHKNFINWLTPLGISVGLFVGKQGVKARREMKQNLKNGQMHIAVGTHALIQEGVEFQNLGGVVIDEQHRFGVKQRSDLKNKGLNPELLTMTATPIPRTLALSVHGDLDLTIIDELPKGRKPVETKLITSSYRKKAYELIRKEIEKNNKAYIVFPLIEESETLSAKAATKEWEKLKEKIFPDLKIGLVHGKLAPSEKEEVMEDFRKGKYDILVSTTVIEVGVDVPDATVMIIENAERFGLSQLHQLRGRVGRSDKQSYCILISDSSSQTKARLEIMTQTNNGFIIAEKDMQLRGPGEFMGTRQSGIPDLLLSDITKDVEILEKAREEAFNLIKNHDIKEFKELYIHINEQINDGLNLINAG